MAEVRGPLTTLNHALPQGLDGTRLAQWALRQGRTYDQVRADVANSLDGLNQELLTLWGDLMYITTDDHMEYPQGGDDTDMPDITDLDDVDARKGTTVGHMIDLRVKGDAIGGTYRYFRDLREATLLASIRGLVRRGRNTFEKALLRRAMITTENALGTSGYDVPFANGSATVTFVPPGFGGKTFLNTHSHYIGIASGSKGFDANLNEAAQHIQEHGHSGPYIAYVSEADVTSYRELKGYSQPVNTQVIMIDRGGETTGNRFFERGSIGAPTQTGGWFYIGSYHSPYGEIQLRAIARIPTGYSLTYKSYGQNDSRNPIAVRTHPASGFGFYIVEVPSNRREYPVAKIRVEMEYGISCGMDRTIGAAAYRAAGGSYVNPTIS